VELWELSAREQVRHLVASYTWAGDRGRTAEVAECFTADGVLDVGDRGGRWEGRAEIARQLDAVVERIAASGSTPTPVHHHVSSVLISDVTDRSASVRSYFVVMSDAGVDHWGRYLDRVVLDGDRWRFAERRVVVDGAAPGSRVVEPAPG
jgi:hypothetical protein